jgi:hypothetical protein
MREKFKPLIKSCGTRPDSYRDVPAAGIESIGLQADALVSWFLHRRQDNFILTLQIRTIYLDSAIWTTLS